MNDFKQAVRLLVKSPAFTVIAVGTLALGIGASSTVFSLIQGVLLTPPPYPHPERMVLINSTRVGGQRDARGWPAAQWQEWQRETKAFEAIAGYGWTFNYLVLPDGSESIEGMAVTPDYFKVAGLPPAVGRAFDDSDTQEGARNIIIGYDLWQRRFNADPNVIGKPVTISRRSRPFTVVGVMPPNVRFLPVPNVSSEPNYDVDAKVDYWLPVRVDPNRLKRRDWEVIGRLRPGATLEQAQAELTALTTRQAKNDRDFEGVAPRLQSLEAEINREGRRLLLPVGLAVALVFLIACGNAAGLLLARGLQRQHEHAVRAALGARGFQLCRPILAESLLLASLGGALGAALAVWCVDALKLVAGTAIPRLDAVQVGWPLLAFCIGSAIVAGLVAGLLPAWRSLARDPASDLNAGSRTASVGRTERRLLGSVAALQIALTLALLVGAGLLIQSVHSLNKVRPGFDTENILTMSVTTVGTNWRDFHTRAIEQVGSLPAVKAAAFGWGVPLTGNKWITTFEIDGESADNPNDQVRLPTRSITPDYFSALGLRLVDGRAFRSSDDEKAPRVAIINQAAVNRFFPGRSPIGRRLRVGSNSTNFVEIIGVLADMRTEALTEDAEPEVYFPFWQSGAFSKHLVVRTHTDPEPLARAVEKELRTIDPTVSVENVKTLEQIRAESVAPRTFAMNLLLGFAVMACLLSSVGIYGVLSLAANSRRTEIAIRMAIGAQRADVLRLILGGGVRLAAVGIGVGLVIALALASGLKTYLFRVQPADPLTLIGMVVVIMAITLATCWIPAYRATRVDPLAALRNE